jgi:hypothetical protein
VAKTYFTEKNRTVLYVTPRNGGGGAR